jgi:hypothetical protein
MEANSMRPFRRCAGAIAAIAALACASSALAADGDTTLRSCVNAGGNLGCSAAPLISGAYAASVSPDGKHLYATSFDTNAIVQFNVNRNTGALTRVAGPGGCIKETPSAGDCQDGSNLVTATDVLISPNGKQVYVSAFNSNAITIYDRNTTSGQLTQKAGALGCVTEGGSGGACTTGRSLASPINLIFGPGTDPTQVYSLGGNGSVTTFDRNPTTGVLTQKALEAGCINNTGASMCGNGRALGGFVTDFGLAADGRHLYAPTSAAGGILLFNRDLATGEITQKTGSQGCVTFDGSDGTTALQCIDGSNDLAGTQSVVLSPNGAHVYALTGSGVVVSSRNSSTGLLTQTSCITETGSGGACVDGTSVTALWDGAFSGDGRDMAVGDGNQNATFTDGGLRFFRRNTTTGALTQRSASVRCTTQDGDGGACLTQGTMGGYGLVSWDPNDRFLYAAENTRGAVATFERDFAPVCQPRSAGVPLNTSVQLQLSCSDRNNDAITYAVTRAPAAGLTGAVTPSGQVFYNPFTGFFGGDSFDYRGTARGVASNTARFDLSVSAPPPQPSPPPPPPPPLKVLPSVASFDTLAFRKYTVFVTFSVNNLPRGSTVTVTCKTKKKKQQKKGCPYKRKRYRNLSKAKLSLRKAFKNKRVPVKAKITITISTAGYIDKRITYTIRKSKRPKSLVQCIPPGGKPTSCSRFT